MAISKKDGYWRLDFRIKGANSKRIVKRFNTKSEAERYQRWLITQHDSGQPWNETSTDRRTLKELAELWHQLHGQYLKDGDRRLSAILSAADALGNPEGRKLSALDYLQYRSCRSKSGIQPKTLNNETSYVSGVFNKLAKLGILDYSNPLASIEPVKVPERELTYLTHAQIDELLHAINQAQNPHVELVTLVSLTTGARWGEAEGLTRSRVHQNMVTFADTKNGKVRSVPIYSWLFERLLSHNAYSGDRLFGTSTISAFRRALARTTIQLPAGQQAHVLRHTFASHFMINGGNILTLQRILGHSDIRVTMRYAHLAPDHLQDAIRLNPLADYQKVTS